MKATTTYLQMCNQAFADTKKALATAHKEFSQTPSASNWVKLECAMLTHQNSYQMVRDAKETVNQ